MSKLQLTSSPEPLQHLDTLRIDFEHKKAEADFSRITFTDKDTNQRVHYVPAFDISSYGETDQKAFEMLQTTLQEYLDWLLELSSENLTMELHQLGFQQMPLGNKEFSKRVTDGNGQLQNLNAVENVVNRSSLSFAA